MFAQLPAHHGAHTQSMRSEKLPAQACKHIVPATQTSMPHPKGNIYADHPQTQSELSPEEWRVDHRALNAFTADVLRSCNDDVCCVVRPLNLVVTQCGKWKLTW